MTTNSLRQYIAQIVDKSLSKYNNNRVSDMLLNQKSFLLVMLVVKVPSGYFNIDPLIHLDNFTSSLTKIVMESIELSVPIAKPSLYNK